MDVVKSSRETRIGSITSSFSNEVTRFTDAFSSASKSTYIHHIHKGGIQEQESNKWIQNLFLNTPEAAEHQSRSLPFPYIQSPLSVHEEPLLPWTHSHQLNRRETQYSTCPQGADSSFPIVHALFPLRENTILRIHLHLSVIND